MLSDVDNPCCACSPDGIATLHRDILPEVDPVHDAPMRGRLHIETFRRPLVGRTICVE